MNAVGIFVYNFGNGIEFTNEQQLPEEFCNVKKHFKLHLESKYHKEKVSSLEEKEKHKKLTWSRNQKTGMLIGRTCYRLFLKEGPSVIMKIYSSFSLKMDLTKGI